MSITATVNDIEVVRMSVMSNYKTPCRRMTYSTPFLNGIDIGSSVTGKINETTMFNGIVKAITKRRPEMSYDVSCGDILSQAVEYFFAPSPNIDSSWTRSNILHYNLVRDILAKAEITDFSNDWGADEDINPYTELPRGSFTFATGEEPVRIKISSAWDIIDWICQITGSHVYADVDNVVHLGLIWDEPIGVPTHSFVAPGTLKSIQYIRSEEGLRNKVIVFGYSGITKEAYAESPYVPENFYKTAILSHEFIDTEEIAQETADINLHRLNKLTESVIFEALGQTDIDIRETVSITDPSSGVSGSWFVTQCTHTVGKDSGYTIRVTCNK